MPLETLLARTERTLRAHPDSASGAKTGADSAWPVPSLFALTHRAPTRLEATLYEPLYCLILRGRKETTLGARVASIGPGDGLLVSHDVPVVSRITEASREQPYVALVLMLDTAMLRGLYDEVADALPAVDTGAFEVEPASEALLDGLERYLALADSPVDQKVLGPAVLRELHFRLLMSPSGGMLRRLLRHDSTASQVARAIALIRQGFRAPLMVPDLAAAAGMSPSSFHKHFKAVTATTPLQYQKELRLLEAHRLLATEGHAVSDAAFAVGYESPTQFSREYKRKFGTSPSQDRRVA